MSSPKILAFAGSSRKGSLNQRVLRIAMRAAQAAGAEVNHVDLRELELPIYDGDLEAASGLPQGAVRLKDLLLAHDGLLIACPEYNSGYTPLLKNAIDWASRARPGEGPLACFTGKTAGLVSASPGALGGLRALAELRSLLQNIRVTVVPNMVASGRLNDDAFDADGNLKDDRQQGLVGGVAKDLVAALS